MRKVFLFIALCFCSSGWSEETYALLMKSPPTTQDVVKAIQEFGDFIGDDVDVFSCHVNNKKVSAIRKYVAEQKAIVYTIQFSGNADPADWGKAVSYFVSTNYFPGIPSDFSIVTRCNVMVSTMMTLAITDDVKKRNGDGLSGNGVTLFFSYDETVNDNQIPTLQIFLMPK